ncbi:MAG: RdgB/HAM1 family non-canonical purine NTP pyrophosphatase [Lachnospiraceae bacterium]|nr:RdgB/HAM1 family non-canonical purine NTP pyrophosphatase [Lachnospiraceae bacterium]
MKKLIFATSNKNKMIEVRAILEGIDAEILSMKEAGIESDPEETGTTFAENALIKARAVAKEAKEKFGAENCEVIALADDSGLEVDYMNKEPGIYSARFLGHDTSYDIKNNYILDKLKGVPEEKRSARFVCSIAIILDDGTEDVVTRTIEGRIGHEIKGENGFGYDPIFFVPEYGVTSAELTPEQKNAISHRGKALSIIKEKYFK